MMDQAWTIPVAWANTLHATTDRIQNFATIDADGQMYLHDVWLMP